MVVEWVGGVVVEWVGDVVVEWVRAWASSSPAPCKYLDVPHTTREVRSEAVS